MWSNVQNSWGACHTDQNNITNVYDLEVKIGTFIHNSIIFTFKHYSMNKYLTEIFKFSQNLRRWYGAPLIICKNTWPGGCDNWNNQAMWKLVTHRENVWKIWWRSALEGSASRTGAGQLQQYHQTCGNSVITITDLPLILSLYQTLLVIANTLLTPALPPNLRQLRDNYHWDTAHA